MLIRRQRAIIASTIVVPAFHQLETILDPPPHEREKYRAGKSERKGRKGKLLLLLLLFRKIARQFDAR